MLLYLVRHAQSEGNAGVPGAAIDCGLTELGWRQATVVAEVLAGVGIDRVLASPYRRTLETAETIRLAAGAPAEIVPLLHEHHFRAFSGEWPLLSRAALAGQFPAFHIPDSFRDTDWHMPPESTAEAHDRAGRVLADLWQRFQSLPDTRLAVVSHGSPTCRLILAALHVASPDQTDIQIDNASLSILDYRPSHCVLRAANRVEHLLDLEARR